MRELKAVSWRERVDYIFHLLIYKNCKYVFLCMKDLIVFLHSILQKRCFCLIKKRGDIKLQSAQIFPALQRCIRRSSYRHLSIHAVIVPPVVASHCSVRHSHTDEAYGVKKLRIWDGALLISFSFGIHFFSVNPRINRSIHCGCWWGPSQFPFT